MKTLQELTLLDKFLFDEAMEDTETYEALLRIILGDEQLQLLTAAQTEKEIRTMPWLRSIRVDVFSMDLLGTIYNTEMQKEKREDLIRRTRYYQALIDSSLLEPGVVNYNSMNNTTIIMIMPFDLFGLGRYVYTFEEVCTEDNSLKMNDGAKRIFVNTHGTNKEDFSVEFVALMEFVEYNRDIDTDMQGNNLSKIIQRVSQLKANEEVGVRYMQKWEEEILIKEEGREEGREEGKTETSIEYISNLMKNMNLSAEDAMKILSIPKEEYAKYLKILMDK
ncbi:MAG: Rpn family recombination-promoting nuclease/putative transposase [Pseudobutyrivibrio sp.]|nr:Rpn family recombination-promoting nuclease/putative transposase [Pseudobutyrivibrio sp.]